MAQPVLAAVPAGRQVAQSPHQPRPAHAPLNPLGGKPRFLNEVILGPTGTDETPRQAAEPTKLSQELIIAESHAFDSIQDEIATTIEDANEI